MVEPLDIALAVHEVCLKTLIDDKISPPHNFDQHIFMSGVYARAINEAGLEDAEPSDIREAIIKAANWDMKSKWPGHPAPTAVIKQLTENL